MGESHEEGTSTYETSWYSTDWKKKRKMLWRERINFLLGRHSLVALASDHYSAAGSAGAHDGFIWRLRKMWCGAIAFVLALLAYGIGVEREGMTELEIASRYDILQSVFRAAGRDGLALSCIEEALSRDLPYHHHSPALLLLSKAQILARRGEKEKARKLARDEALQRVINEIPQLVRVHKNAAVAFKLTGDKGLYQLQKEKALQLAERHGVKDQVAKIEAI